MNQEGLMTIVTLAKYAALGLAKTATEYYVNKGINKVN